MFQRRRFAPHIPWERGNSGYLKDQIAQKKKDAQQERRDPRSDLSRDTHTCRNEGNARKVRQPRVTRNPGNDRQERIGRVSADEVLDANAAIEMANKYRPCLTIISMVAISIEAYHEQRRCQDRRFIAHPIFGFTLEGQESVNHSWIICHSWRQSAGGHDPRLGREEFGVALHGCGDSYRGRGHARKHASGARHRNRKTPAGVDGRRGPAG